MRGTVSEFLIERLMSSGVDTVFGLPGDYSLKFYNNLCDSKLNVVGMTNEAAAGFAADAYARVKGIGCVCVTYCVGGFNIVNSVACAYAEKSPVVIISGSPGLKERDGKVLLHHMVGSFECQHKMFEHITCANTVLRDPERAGYEIDRVLTAAQEYKQPVYIELPRDMVDKPIRYDPYTLLTPKERKTDQQNLDESMAEVVSWINEAKNPVIWAGVECARFGLDKKLIKFCEQTNIPVATTILGKSVVNERHPLSLGVYCESTAPDDLRAFMESSDCIIMLGVMMTDMNTGFLPLKYQKRNIVLATSQTLQVRNHSYEDVKFSDFADALFKSKVNKREVPRIPKKQEITFVSEAGKKITAQRMFEKINSILDKNMAIVADVGDSLFGALDLTVHDSHHFISDAFYTSMGFAMPGAVGVQAARPDVRPIVIVGDGAFQMTGMEFSTLVRRKSNAIVFVMNNSGYGTERVMLDGKFNDIQMWEFDKIPMIVGGGLGHKVETEDQLDYAISCALRSNGPTIINVILGQHDHTPALKRMFTKLAKRC
jgi:indolepyruvate decarboxylase